MKIRSVFTALSLSVALGSVPVQAADKVTFQLDWLPGGDKAPVYVGIQQGFFADEDLEVSIAGGRGSTDAITKLATGNADIGLSDIGALLAARAQSRVPVTAVYSVFTQAPHAFMVLEGSGINSVRDVAGKKVATSPFTSSNVYLPLLLKDNGLEMSDIRLTKSDPGSLSPMMVTGQTDVVISWVTDTQRYRAQAESAGKSLKVLPWSEAGLELYSATLVANERFLEERPDVAKRFVRAFAKAVSFTHEHPVTAGENINAMVPEVDAAVAAATITDTMKLVFNEVSARDGMGRLEPTRLANTWQLVAAAQDLDASAFDVETAVNRSFMPEQ
ncbi:MAG: ABC transporter substrate-binding protein [Oceanospirillaceae bacterium]|nr:ABC transporter substrate-binding protein [Oceanospirillaceae bacterium]